MLMLWVPCWDIGPAPCFDPKTDSHGANEYVSVHLAMQADLTC